MIHSFERQSHSVPQRPNAPEKSSIHLVEAHDWMGPESLTDSAQLNQVLATSASGYPERGKHSR